MVKRKRTGKRGGLSIKQQIGQRFKKFRETIGKTQVQLAWEFKVYQSTITNIEVGKTFPNIKYLHHLGKAYRLNADWLINNRGEIFQSQVPIPTAVFEKYRDLVGLMQVPVVEQLILARFEEVKVIAREDIEAYQAMNSETESGNTS